ncbi:MULTISPECIES: carbon-nitrogen hydrolase family protein [Vibrio]|uniref:Carbon-nitrogen hydrolase family protein n=1 Tax=Vibrio ostreae TaxID=2841925 RepID=A0A975UAS7_9VIBR|nr:MULTISPECIES: carbon-nitrogen hydrolase family protein [Vibrio]QXO17099.1 carbon-nitrogen hydrolase family protein [Vibrio ostreae]WGY48586.1 carbon-nitrogen hydrolase family protein [Vibrio sp. ABG19]
MQRVGLIQMTSGPDVEQNLAYIARQAQVLAGQGAEWVVTPENAVVLGNREDYHSHAEAFGQGPMQAELSRIARDNQLWLLVGSMPIARAEGVTTTSILFNPQGAAVAHYDKLHMFDVDVADGHQRYRESETFTPGNQVVVVPTPFGQLGLSICYDVRFPNLYAELRRLGAQILLVPAAFTAVTGRAHWEVLLRARAIETQCWVIAVGQGGHHPCGRETWGHSMIINPWGEVVASLGQSPANLVADIELDQLDRLRRTMPIIEHTRFDNQFKEIKS